MKKFISMLICLTMLLSIGSVSVLALNEQATVQNIMLFEENFDGTGMVVGQNPTANTDIKKANDNWYDSDAWTTDFPTVTANGKTGNGLKLSCANKNYRIRTNLKNNGSAYTITDGAFVIEFDAYQGNGGLTVGLGSAMATTDASFYRPVMAVPQYENTNKEIVTFTELCPPNPNEAGAASGYGKTAFTLDGTTAITLPQPTNTTSYSPYLHYKLLVDVDNQSITIELTDEEGNVTTSTPVNGIKWLDATNTDAWKNITSVIFRGSRTDIEGETYTDLPTVIDNIKIYTCDTGIIRNDDFEDGLTKWYTCGTDTAVTSSVAEVKTVADWMTAYTTDGDETVAATPNHKKADTDKILAVKPNTAVYTKFDNNKTLNSGTVKIEFDVNPRDEGSWGIGMLVDGKNENLGYMLNFANASGTMKYWSSYLGENPYMESGTPYTAGTGQYNYLSNWKNRWNRFVIEVNLDTNIITVKQKYLDSTNFTDRGGSTKELVYMDRYNYKLAGIVLANGTSADTENATVFASKPKYFDNLRIYTEPGADSKTGSNKVRVEFKDAVNTSLVEGKIVVKDAEGTALTPKSYEYSSDGKMALVELEEDMVAGSEYTVEILSGIKYTDGYNVMPSSKAVTYSAGTYSANLEIEEPLYTKGSKVTATGTISHTDFSDGEDVEVIVAAYNEQGIFIGAEIGKAKYSSFDYGTVNVFAELTLPEDAKTLRCFIWNDELTPLMSQSVDYSNDTNN